MATGIWAKFLEEVGLTAFHGSPTDTKLLCLQRFIRLFAYGNSTLILALYLSALGISETRIGLFMTLTLVGDVAISFCLTLFADGVGRKVVLALGAVLMSASGIVFALSGNYWVLLAAAILGVISPSGNEIGPFRAIEESILAQLTPAAVRSDVFAWYTLIGTSGTALGLLTCGWIVQHLQSLDGWDTIRAYRIIFVLYAIFGVLKFFLAITLSNACESESKKSVAHGPASETSPLLSSEAQEPSKKSVVKSLLPSISRETKLVVFKLCLLFAVDSFASGLVPSSWVTYFFNRKFHLLEGRLGSLFFTTSLISAASTIVASSISKRVGLIKTMVFTHLPSAIALALIPIPSSLPFAMLFLILRSCTQSMDVAPRSAFLAAVLKPGERTAAMGFINVVKTLSQSAGPLITGVLAGKGIFWVAFVVAGSLKASYDLGMLAMFVNHKSHEDTAEEERRRVESGRSDDTSAQTTATAGPTTG